MNESSGEVPIGRRLLPVWLPDDVYRQLQQKATVFGTLPGLLAEAVIRATVPRLHTQGPRLTDDELRAYCDGYCRGAGLPEMPNDYDQPPAAEAALGAKDFAR